ncbi:hypothetical protein HK104_004004 [Borealophlyctis nickersoniae]|nr:hypothetical protein HK104_004004 [Borealophlyctis nickersoniae]
MEEQHDAAGEVGRLEEAGGHGGEWMQGEALAHDDVRAQMQGEEQALVHDDVRAQLQKGQALEHDDVRAQLAQFIAQMRVENEELLEQQREELNRIGARQRLLEDGFEAKRETNRQQNNLLRDLVAQTTHLQSLIQGQEPRKRE